MRTNRFSNWMGIFCVLAGCAAETATPGDELGESADLGGKADTVDDLTARELDQFASAADFDAYIEALRPLQPARRAIAFGTASAESAPGAAAESITNNQEEGVDEGGIVKAYGDFLVVLRRGRLFTMRLATTGGRPALEAVSALNAYPAGSDLGTWYDEMLIHENTVVVVGYSYTVGATEIGLFDIDSRGGLRHRQTHFLRSNDYYSSRNYASRLVDGKLVFYMPYNLFSWSWAAGSSALESTLPGVRAATDTTWTNIVDKTEVYRPVQRVLSPTLHTVVTCDLESRSLDCTARGVVGPYARSFYVSRDSVYLWVSANDFSDPSLAATGPDAVVYRMPLDGSAPGAVRAYGQPTDQFSFKADDDELFAVVRAEGGGDAMWSPELTAGDVGLARIPFTRFSGTLRNLPVSQYTTLPNPGAGWSFQNRFVGEHLLYGASGGGWGATEPTVNNLYVRSLAARGTTRTLSLTHQVGRIEVMGDSAVVIGNSGSDLHFSSIALDRPRVADIFIQPGASEGEARSHGFFFKPNAEGNGGILGLPTQRSGGRWSHLTHGSAEVLFLDVADRNFRRLGALEAASTEPTDDMCQVSCVDWYGNARPIFYQGRIFALMGYEMVEGDLFGSSITERGRLDFSAPLHR